MEPTDAKRRLSAILMADVVGYSCLMQQDEEALFREMGMEWWMEQAEGLRGRIERGEEFKWFAPYVDWPPAV